MNRTLCIGNEDGIIAVGCPKCDCAMEKEDGGYSEFRSVDGYEQREYSDYWKCPNCGYKMSESELDPMTAEDWGFVMQDRRGK